MLNAEERQLVRSVTTVTQVIVGALIAGVASYLGFTLWHGGGQPAPNADDMLPMIGLGFAGMAAVTAAVLPRVIGAQQRAALVKRPAVAVAAVSEPKLSDAQALLAGFQIRRIIAGALLEGGAFFNTFLFQSQRQTANLVAVLALILAMLTLVPLRPLVEQWLERELREVRELRELGRPR